MQTPLFFPPFALQNSTPPDWWQTAFPQGRQTLQIRDANDCLVSISYGEKGTGQPLFLVHGVASWSYSWRANIDALAQHYRVICFDAKNSGFSQKCLRSEKPGHKLIELLRIMQALCDQPAIVVAESLGALVAMGAIQERPDLFDRLILMNVPIFLKQLPNWVMRLLAEVPLDWVRAVDHLGLPNLLAPVIRQLVYEFREEVVADRNHITPEDIYWTTYPHLTFPHTLAKLAEEFQHAAAEIRRLERGEPNLIRSVQERLAEITCPTLILWAEHDRWFPVKDGEKLRNHLPNAQFRIIPNCGHYAAGSQPEFVNAAILQFLQETAVDRQAIPRAA